MKIVSGSANKPLAERVAAKFGVPLTPLEIFIFPDGERRVRVLENVLEEDCVIIQPTNPPVDTNYIELFLIADALKRSGARLLTIVMPYMGYQRQDHIFRDGEAVSLDVMIKATESLGASRIISFDLHSIKIPELFHMPITHISALSLFAETIKRQGWNDSNTVLVSPDMGGIRRIEILSKLLDSMPYVTITKNRDLETGFVEAASFDGKLKKRAILVDDMISSGNTIVKAAELLNRNEVEEMYTFVTHPIFSAEAPMLLEKSLVEKVFVTDGVLVPEDKLFSKLEILSLSDMISTQLTS